MQMSIGSKKIRAYYNNNVKLRSTWTWIDYPPYHVNLLLVSQLCFVVIMSLYCGLMYC